MYSMSTLQDCSKLRGRIAEISIRHADLAGHLGINATLLSAILHRRRPPPADFFERVNAVLDREEAVRKALQETKEKVLKEWGA